MSEFRCIINYILCYRRYASEDTHTARGNRDRERREKGWVTEVRQKRCSLRGSKREKEGRIKDVKTVIGKHCRKDSDRDEKG